MKKSFHTKIGMELLIPILIVLGATTALLLKDGGLLPGLFISPALVLLLYIGFKTKYVIHDDKVLEITSGFLFKRWIAIHTIRIIRETNNPLSAPAASLDRLELVFENHHRVIISPRRKEAFIQALLAINPGIEVIRRKRR